MKKMLRLIGLIGLLMCLFSTVAFSQTLTVKGTVTDVEGVPITGATVIVLGQKNLGSMTDIDGHFTIHNVPSKATIRISFVGMITQEMQLKGESRLNIVMKEDAEVLDELVVTALGIKRSEKVLSYNVQELKSEALTTIKEPNFINSLSGRVAGIQINKSGAGVGGAARVVMRGAKSIEGSNNVLYVVDGMPLFNTTSGADSGIQGEGRVASEGIADFNPEDIASLTVLSGPSAAALYGSSRAIAFEVS